MSLVEGNVVFEKKKKRKNVRAILLICIITDHHGSIRHLQEMVSLASKGE